MSAEAWALYLVGFVVVATTPLEYPHQASGRNTAIGIFAGLLWPIGAVAVAGHRLWRAYRHG